MSYHAQVQHIVLLILSDWQSSQPKSTAFIRNNLIDTFCPLHIMLFLQLCRTKNMNAGVLDKYSWSPGHCRQGDEKRWLESAVRHFSNASSYPRIQEAVLFPSLT